jgi:hypothetical protein
MRTQIALLLAAFVFVFAILFATASRPATASVQSAQAGKCTDAKLLTQVSKDLTDFSTALKGFDPKSDKGVARGLLDIAILRQKYEDLEKVPVECFGVQLYMVQALANYGDALSLIIAAKADPDNAKVYTDAVAPQIERANKILTLLTGEIGAAATPAK